MKILQAGRLVYHISGSDPEIVLTHALGSAFVELQQLEFSIISYLTNLTGDGAAFDLSFDIFASKTFGNLMREMDRHDFLKPLVKDITTVKLRRDFFIHKFLFHRYGGPALTLDTEYEELIQDAVGLGELFAGARAQFDNFMLQNAPLIMLAAKRDPATEEWVFVESEFSKKQA